MNHVTVPQSGNVAEQIDPAAFRIDETQLQALTERLRASAESAGMLEVAYRTIDSPIGTLLLASTAAGLVRVAFEREDFDLVLTQLAARVSPRVMESPGRLDVAARELDEYFAGARHAFDVPLDFAMSSGFRRAVLQQLPRIGYGQTQSYKQIALAAGSPNAVRAVGTACATNPLPVIVPCHRVLRSDGGIGGYLGGLEVKRQLLALEQDASTESGMTDR